MIIILLPILILDKFHARRCVCGHITSQHVYWRINQRSVNRALVTNAARPRDFAHIEGENQPVRGRRLFGAIDRAKVQRPRRIVCVWNMQTFRHMCAVGKMSCNYILWGGKEAFCAHISEVR